MPDELYEDAATDLISSPEDFLQQFVFYNTYARWNEELGRRETWEEAVGRVVSWMQGHIKANYAAAYNSIPWEDLRVAMLHKRVLPSMRILQMAGPSLDRCHVGAYNCAYLPLEGPNDIADLLYIMMQGTGVGFSVEDRYVSKWPQFPSIFDPATHPYQVHDTTEDWCDSIKYCFESLLFGYNPSFDYSLIRPHGAPLKTKGGYASGPDPLRDLHDYIIKVVTMNGSSHLSALQIHDIATKAGSIVEVGGTRRAAQISLSDFNDLSMRNAKSGDWWLTTPWRSMANNSAVVDAQIDLGDVYAEFGAMIESKSGERGIFNRKEAQRRAREIGREVQEFGVNPCGEIILRPRQFCNLSSVVIRPSDSLATIKDLSEAVELATIWGTLQSTLTHFTYIDARWKQNCEEERLLGVDLTGQADCKEFPLFNLGRLKNTAQTTNRIYARILGINASAAVTTVKPSGNSSQLVNCSSGIHPRYADFYIRRCQMQLNSPMHKWCEANEIPLFRHGDRLGVEIPIAAPQGAKTRRSVSVQSQLATVNELYTYWCDHNVSATVYMKAADWQYVFNGIYADLPESSIYDPTDPEDNGFHQITTGITFLPMDDHAYELAPYEEITEAQYKALTAEFPVNISFSTLVTYDKKAQWQPTREWACAGDKCEII